jgi:outer membrane cobalamin receptor
MGIFSNHTRLFASTALLGATFVITGPTWAAEATDQSAPAAVGELVVTGSRIPTTNVTSPQPIQIISSHEVDARARVHQPG